MKQLRNRQLTKEMRGFTCKESNEIEPHPKGSVFVAKSPAKLTLHSFGAQRSVQLLAPCDVRHVIGILSGWMSNKVSGVQVLGKVLGYPICCITSHEKRLSMGQAYPSETACKAMKKIPRNCRYHWIPCDKCASQILLGTATFASLLAYNRPLIDLTGKLSLPVVQQHAREVLTQEEYAMYEKVAEEGHSKVFKFPVPVPGSAAKSSSAEPKDRAHAFKKPASKRGREPSHPKPTVKKACGGKP